MSDRQIKDLLKSIERNTLELMEKTPKAPVRHISFNGPGVFKIGMGIALGAYLVNNYIDTSNITCKNK